MPESHFGKEILSPAEAITFAMEEWLSLEIENSRVGRNQVLDDYDKFQQAISETHHNPHTNAGKEHAHFVRLTLWTDQFEEEPSHGFIAARQLFAAQMKLSGLFRTHCFVRAVDQNHYERLRFSEHPLSVNAGEQIQKKVAQRSNASEPISSDELVQTTLELNEKTYQQLAGLYDAKKPNAGLRKLVNLMRLNRLQRDWLDLATDYILLAAQVRGNDLRTVPFLEPKSISGNPQIYYPFQR